MRKVWVIQRKVFANGKFLTPSHFDIELYARKEEAKKELEAHKKWAEMRGCEFVNMGKNVVSYTDEDGWEWVYSLHEKILFT
jgi:hypothetical protein